MLAELRVENFAIIEKLTVDFNSGLTVITGETGAGKSIIIDAIGLLVGGRGSSEYVRHGSDKAEIEALFLIHSQHPSVDIAKEIGIEISDDMLVLRRTISSSGKSVCRLNGKLVTLSQLKEIGKTLIDIHGQHEHQDLMEPDKHLILLDQFGGPKLRKAYEYYVTYYRQVEKNYQEYHQLTKNEQETARRLDLLQYQLKEIADANLSETEEDDLIEERRLLMNYERLFQALQVSYEALYGEGKGLEWVGQAMSELENGALIDQSLKSISDAVSNSYYLLEENVYELRNRLDTLEYQPERLELIEARLNDITILKRKYGNTIHEILNYYSQIEKEYHDLINKDVNIERLEKELSLGLQELNELAKDLSEHRKTTAENLIQSINKELKDLYMEKATFSIEIRQSPQNETLDFNQFNKFGIDKVEFVISTNPGEPLKPLVKIASGGELSRIMLAIKTNFKEVTGLTSIIFDEVDTGVSGRVAQAMAEKIYQLSHQSQVFCITHLPQVAAMADHHLYIVKEVKNDRTATKIEKLANESRVAEIGRMISGVEMTVLTKQHAKELLQLAEEIKS